MVMSEGLEISQSFLYFFIFKHAMLVHDQRETQKYELVKLPIKG